MYGHHVRKIMDKIKHIHRYFTKRLKGVYNLLCRERLCNLGRDSLEMSRLQSDLTLCLMTLTSLILFTFNNGRANKNKLSDNSR